MRQDVIEELFEAKYEAEDPGFLRFVREYGSERGDDVLYEVIQSLYTYAQSETFPERWLASLPAGFQVTGDTRLQDTPWMAVIREAVESGLGQCREALEEFQAIVAQLGAAEQPFYEEMAAMARSSLERVAAGLDQGWDEARRAFAAMKSGLGIYAVQLGNLKLAAVVCVNALGDVYDYRNGQKIAGLLQADRKGFADTRQELYKIASPVDMFQRNNTTIGAIITNGDFNKAELTKIASMTRNAYARCINPVGTLADGDTIYAASCGQVKADLNMWSGMANC